MKCAYCASEIAREALVCPVCRRDLYLFKPLLARIAELEAQVAAAPEVKALLERIRVLEAGAAAGGLADGVAAPATAGQEDGVGGSRLGPRGWLLYWGLPLLLLLLAHGLIVVAFDLNTLYLRLVSLLIPLPFGYFLLRNGARSFFGGALAAFAMAALAVLGMSGIVAYTDGVAWLPQGRGEWREFGEYAASVGFSYLTGMLLGRLLARRPEGLAPGEFQGGGWKVMLARHLVSGPPSFEKIQATVTKINEVSSSLVAIGTTALSIYTGLKGLLG